MLESVFSYFKWEIRTFQGFSFYVKIFQEN